MNPAYLTLFLGLAIGAIHIRDTTESMTTGPGEPVDWPTAFEDQPLRPLPLSEIEQGFARSFPGAMAHFQCGDRQVILRQVNRGTRKLHSSATCLRAAGFQVEPVGIKTHHGSPWAAYRATKAGTTLYVREQVHRTDDPDLVWTEMSRWFWAATFHPDNGPWTAVTVIQVR